MEGYIYKLTSPSGKSYVGQTINIKGRFSEYKTLHHCENQKALFNAIKKYGWENFKKEILETIKEELVENLKKVLDELEIEYISKYDCINFGYNICVGGNQHRLGVKETEEQCQRKRDSWTNERRKISSEKFKGISNPRYGSTTKTYSKAINQYDKQGIYIKTWESAASAEREIGCKAANISKVCLGKCLTAGGFIWRFFENSIDNIIPIESQKGKHTKKGIHLIPIFQYSIDGTFLKEFASITDAETELNICHSNISRCAKGKGKTAGGYIWKYSRE